MKGRTSPKGNGGRTAAARTLSRSATSNGLAAVRQAAQRSKQARFTALLHHITIDLLKQSFQSLERNAAPGIDGVTWYAYQEDNLEEKLKDLHGRIHRVNYRTRPAKRTIIPKPDGSQRPLAILCLEDKIVQQAVVFVLEAIYEADFLGFSYGFRPGRGQHECAGRPPSGDFAEKSELGARRGRPRLLFRHEPRLDPAFSRAPDRGQAHLAPYRKMVESQTQHAGSSARGG